MLVTFWALVGFVLGAVAGYCAVLFGWVAYSNMVSVADTSGGTSMGVAFSLAPFAGLLIGMAGAFVFGTRAARRKDTSLD